MRADLCMPNFSIENATRPGVFWKLWLCLKLVVFEYVLLVLFWKWRGRPAFMLQSILFFNIDYSVLFKFPLRVLASFLPEIVLPYFGCKNSGMAIVYLPNLHSILQTVMESVKKQVDTTIAQLNKKSRANRWCREGTSKYQFVLRVLATYLLGLN